MTTNEQRIRELEDELQDWKERAAALEMTPPPEVTETFKTSREEAIALHAVEVMAKIQGDVALKVNERSLAASERYLEAIERGNKLLAKIVKYLDPEATMGLTYEAMRIRLCLQDMSGQSYD